VVGAPMANLVRGFRQGAVALPRVTILEMMEKYGLRVNRMPGRVWFPELEIVHILRCTRRMRYDDNRRARLRRHIMLYGPKDTSKSSISEAFLTDLIGGVDYLHDGRGDGSRPTYLDVGGITWERLRGGAQDGKPIMPMIHDVDYLYASEFFDFVGHHPIMQRERMQHLNKAGEEGKQNVALVKMFGMEDEDIAAFEEACEKTRTRDGRQAVRFNRDHMSLSYDVYAAFIFCSHPFNQKEENIFADSGFTSRMGRVIVQPSDDELLTLKESPHGEPWPEMEKEIQDFNLYAWNAEYRHINFPPRDYIEELTRHYVRTFRAVREDTGLDVDSICEGRETTDAYQLLTAIAIIRHLHEARERGEPKAVIERIDYQREDVERAKRFRAYKLATIERTALKKVREDKEREVSVKSLAKFVQARKTAGERYDRFANKDLVEFIMDVSGVSSQAAYKQASKLHENGYIRQPEGAGVREREMTDAGYRTIGMGEEVRSEEEERAEDEYARIQREQHELDILNEMLGRDDALAPPHVEESADQ
jgi:hypothetical protein